MPVAITLPKFGTVGRMIIWGEQHDLNAAGAQSIADLLSIGADGFD